MAVTELTTLPREERSQSLRRRLRDAVDTHRENHAAMGDLFSQLQKERYYRQWGYADFASCIRQEYGLRLRTAQELIKVHRMRLLLTQLVRRATQGC